MTKRDAKDEKKAPKLRFKGFTDDWEQVKYGEIFQRKSKTGVSSSSLPSVEYDDINPGIGTINKELKSKDTNKKGICFKPGDVLFGKLRPYLKNWFYASFEGVAVGDFWVLTSNKIDHGFTYSLIQTQQFQYIANLSSGSKMPRSDWNLVSSAKTFIPQKLSEQTSISSIFLSIDSAITLHEEKQKQLEQLKKALLQKMFADKSGYPKVRFKGFSEPWEQHKLVDLSEEVKGNDGVVDGLPILTISAANGWMNQKDRFSQVIAGSELKKYTLLKKGELSYNHGNSKLAKFGAVFELDSYKEALVPRVYHSFKMVNGNSPSFIEYLFATKRPDRELSKLITSGARMDGLLNINKKDFFGIKLKVPTPQEQTKISKLLRGLDRTITLHAKKIESLKQLKQALLQQMFI